MRRTVFGIATVVSLWAASVCSASLVVEYDGLAGAFQAPINGVGATGINLTRGAGIDAASGGNFNSNNFSSATLAEAVASDEYLSFGFSVDSGLQLNMTDIQVELDRSGTGPDTVYLLYDADSNGFDAGDLIESMAIPDPGSVLTFNSGLPPGLDASDGTVEFRFYYSGATNPAGTSDIEDDLIGGTTGSVGLQLNGAFTVIPEPTTALIVVVVAGCALIRRRR